MSSDDGPGIAGAAAGVTRRATADRDTVALGLSTGAMCVGLERWLLWLWLRMVGVMMVLVLVLLQLLRCHRPRGAREVHCELVHAKVSQGAVCDDI